MRRLGSWLVRLRGNEAEIEPKIKPLTPGPSLRSGARGEKTVKQRALYPKRGEGREDMSGTANEETATMRAKFLGGVCRFGVWVYD